MIAKANGGKCKLAGCDKDAAIRGLCTGHYQNCLTLISRGTTSWDELVKLEIANPTGQLAASLVLQELLARRAKLGTAKKSTKSLAHPTPHRKTKGR